MPRQPRKFEVGKVFHIIQRGVEQRDIFLKSQDYSRFILSLEFLNSTSPKNLWNFLVGSDPTGEFKVRIQQERNKPKRRIVDILSFVLMPNHYHLILREIAQGGISFFMQKLGGYSSYFNKQYRRVGPLFQSRYKVVPLKDNDQLSVLFAYVHTNPIALIEPGWKEREVRNPEKAIEYLQNYKWSSYCDYIGIPTFPEVTQRELFSQFYGSEQKCKQAVTDWIKYKSKQTQDFPNTFE